jgi:hypothetical protein
MYSYILDLVSVNSIETYSSVNVGTRRYRVYRELNKSNTWCRINAVRAVVIFCVTHSALTFCRFEELQCSRPPLPYLCCLSGCDGFVDMTCLWDILYSKAKRSLKPARLSPAAFNSETEYPNSVKIPSPKKIFCRWNSRRPKECKIHRRCSVITLVCQLTSLMYFDSTEEKRVLAVVSFFSTNLITFILEVISNIRTFVSSVTGP